MKKLVKNHAITKKWQILLAAVFIFAAVQIVYGFTLTGTEHLDVSTPMDPGYLYDSSSADIHSKGSIGNAYLYDNTRLRLIEDYSSVNYVYAYGSSQLSMSSHISDIRYIESYNGSTVNISDGYVAQAGSGGYLQAYDNSTVNLSGGQVGGMSKGVLNAWDSSTVNISGGSHRLLYAYNTSTVYISGGYTNEVVRGYGNSSINISESGINPGLGGCLYKGLSAYDFSQVTISGGDLLGNLSAYNSSQVTWSGGYLWSTNCLILEQNAQVIINGFDFAIDGMQIAYGQYYASDYANGLL